MYLGPSKSNRNKLAITRLYHSPTVAFKGMSFPTFDGLKMSINSLILDVFNEIGSTFKKLSIGKIVKSFLVGDAIYPILKHVGQDEHK